MSAPGSRSAFTTWQKTVGAVSNATGKEKWSSADGLYS